MPLLRWRWWVEEFRRHALFCPHGRPEGVRRLDVRFDHAAFPVWGWGTVPARAGRPALQVVGMVRPDRLDLSARLVADLRAWSDWQDRHSEYGGRHPATGEQRQAWFARGKVLARRLADETGAEVVYAWPSQGADPDCPFCGDRAEGLTHARS